MTPNELVGFALVFVLLVVFLLELMRLWHPKKQEKSLKWFKFKGKTTLETYKSSAGSDKTL